MTYRPLEFLDSLFGQMVLIRLKNHELEMKCKILDHDNFINLLVVTMENKKAFIKGDNVLIIKEV